MLRAVNRLHGLDLSDDELRAIAATLGSDVPFFVGGGSAIVEGLGEQVRSLPTPPSLHVVIVLPDVACPTGHVYRVYDELAGPAANDPAREAVLALAEARPPAPEHLFNDLAAAAVRAKPDLGEHLDALGRLAERPAHVAGSGSSLFVLCDDRPHASALARTVEKDLGLPAVAVQTVSLDPP
jgi:4-diphosphocytidyl-2-C-methyl-D-erythritol kinase